MRWIALTALCVVGCLGTKTTVCDDGTICPSGLVCSGRADPACTTQAALDSCKGKPDRTACSLGPDRIGSCAAEVCGDCKPEWVECRYNSWQLMQSPTAKDLFALWAAAPNDVYAVGLDSTVIHYDGTEWKPFAMPTPQSHLNGIWGASPTNLFAVTNGDRVLFQFDGLWQSTTAGVNDLFFGVWGAGANDVYVVGSAGHMQHYDGAWSASTVIAAATLQSISGRNATDIYAAGNSGTIVHYDGLNWQAAPNTPLAGITFYGIWVSSIGQAFVVGADTTRAHVVVQQGTGWNMQIVETSALRGVWGTSSDDVFAVGDMGTIVHYDGTWSPPMTSPSQSQLNAVGGIVADGATDVFAVGNGGTILRYSP